MHTIILKSIDNKNAGIYRKNNVLISGSKHRSVEYMLVEEKMGELLSWYNASKEQLQPVELAALFHFKYVYIHPFIDGNGRTARLLMNLILLRNGYPMAIIKNEDRSEYMKALEMASVNGQTDAFVSVIARAVDSSLGTYLYMLQ